MRYGVKKTCLSPYLNSFTKIALTLTCREKKSNFSWPVKLNLNLIAIRVEDIGNNFFTEDGRSIYYKINPKLFRKTGLLFQNNQNNFYN